MSEQTFVFAEILWRSRELRGRLMNALGKSSDEKSRMLAEEVPQIRWQDAQGDAPLLSLAFVGQYNAGKSTIISALTGRADIPIDADVCTDTVTAYDWNGIQLLDTPGIHAGYPSHDAITLAAMHRADLLVFVLTNELFDDVIGSHFRELAFAQKKAPEMMLVVNKMGQDPGTPEIKKRDIEKVTEPLSCEDFRTVFVDARTYLEALDTPDEEERAELLEIANLKALVEGLNVFVKERGLLGRLTAPLFAFRSSAQQALAYILTEVPEERAAIELLHRKKGIFLSSRARLVTNLRGLLVRLQADIIALGDKVAGSIELGKQEQEVRKAHEEAQRQAEDRCRHFAEECRRSIEHELQELERQLEALQNSVLARELQGEINAKLSRGRLDSQQQFTARPEWQAGAGTIPPEWLARLRRISEVANDIGKYAARWATGPFAEGTRIGSMTTARGSQAHRVVYDVGKFFGVKFRPWGAVRVARGIGIVGRVLGVIGGVLAVFAQIKEDKELDRYRRELKDARDQIRTAYREMALAVEKEFWEQFDRFSQDFYGTEIAAVDDLMGEISTRRQGRNTEAETFAELARQVTTLIDYVQPAVGKDNLSIASEAAT